MYGPILGYELWCSAAAAPQLWDLVWEAGMPYGMVPAGILALDVARVEAGLLLLVGSALAQGALLWWAAASWFR